jgi:hypothetical protein
MQDPIDPLDFHPDILVHIAYDIFAAAGCVQRCNLAPHKLHAFISAIKERHQPNSYHNWYHAFHVLLNTSRFTIASVEFIPAYDMLALLLAAICHDLDHCGVSNAKLAELQDPLAVQYKTSPLESNSVSITLQVLDTPGCDVLSSLPVEAQRSIRALLKDLIMATDITNTDTVGFVQEEWKRNVEVNTFDWKSEQARAALLRMTLLCADIGIVSEYFDIFIHWVRALFAEINVMLNGSLDMTNFYEGQLKFLNGYAQRIFHATCNAHLLLGFETYTDRFNSNVVKMTAANHLGAGLPVEGKREEIRKLVLGWIKSHKLEWSFEERDRAISEYKGAALRIVSPTAKAREVQK